MSNKPRKKKTNNPPRQTTSFANMVGNAQLNALKPFIEQQVQLQGFQIQQKVSRLFLEQLGAIQTRIIALEELLLQETGVTKEALSLKVTEVEDKGMGFELVEGPAQQNDLLRIDYKEKAEGEEYTEDWQKLRINSLAREVEGRVQTIKELELALVGMSAGEEKEVYLPPEEGQNGEEVKGAYILVKVARVSRKLTPPKKETSDADNSTSK